MSRWAGAQGHRRDQGSAPPESLRGAHGRAGVACGGNAVTRFLPAPVRPPSALRLGLRLGFGALSRKRVLNPVKNIARDSRGRIAGCFKGDENDPYHVGQADTCRAFGSIAGSVRREFDADVGTVLGR